MHHHTKRNKKSPRAVIFRHISKIAKSDC